MRNFCFSNPNLKIICGKVLWGILLLVHLGPVGCATISDITEKNPYWNGQARLQPEMGWWRVAFKINWPPEKIPLWHVDLLIAHQVIYPVLNARNTEIALWRFHRRAGMDAAGHQFSFIFYTTAESAETIISQIQANPILAALKQSGELIQIFSQPTDSIKKPAVEMTSDSHWSEPMQKAWPYYIMGVSQMWLVLIDQYALEFQITSESTIADLNEFYKRVNAEITETWQTEGRHALLHHLNALFGYQPLWLKFNF